MPLRLKIAQSTAAKAAVYRFRHQVFVEEENLPECRSLRRVICSGEALPYALQERLLARLPEVQLHNLYGPTEASVDVTSWACVPGDPRRMVPIGRPIANTQCYVLASRLEPADFREPLTGRIDTDSMIDGLEQARAMFAGSHLIHADAVKVFADGVLEGNPYGDPPTLPNAAMLEPYRQPLFEVDLEQGIADGDFKPHSSRQLLISIYGMTMSYFADAEFIRLLYDEDPTSQTMLEERLEAYENIIESEIGDTQLTRARNIEREVGVKIIDRSVSRIGRRAIEDQAGDLGQRGVNLVPI